MILISGTISVLTNALSNVYVAKFISLLLYKNVYMGTWQRSPHIPELEWWVFFCSQEIQKNAEVTDVELNQSTQWE